jgi:hypothetical protein
MSVGGPVLEVGARRVEAWATALRRPVRLAGTADAIDLFRYRTDVAPELLGPDVVVGLAAEDDRYVASLERRVPQWRPAGTKSGPNLQWWRTLEAVAGPGRPEWVLLLEPDTSPVGDDVERRLEELVVGNPDAWVIGALPHAASLARLDPRLRDHLNGVALYHVGDERFLQFIRSVWVPSLVSLLQQQPDIAYDCMTAPSLWLDLPGALSDAWMQNATRFVRTGSMVNASALSGEAAQRALVEAVSDPDTWLVHSKALI